MFFDNRVITVALTSLQRICTSDSTAAPPIAVVQLPAGSLTHNEGYTILHTKGLTLGQLAENPNQLATAQSVQSALDYEICTNPLAAKSKLLRLKKKEEGELRAKAKAIAIPATPRPI